MIKVEIVKESEHSINLRIVHQTLRNIGFYAFNDQGKNPRLFKAKNGWTLQSAGGPELIVGARLLFVRGSVVAVDNIVLNIPRRIYDDIMQAIDEYNIAYAQHEKNTTEAHKSHLRLPLK